MVIQRDLSYDDTIAARRFDLFVPETEKPAPLIVMIHGGGWISGDRSMYHDEATWYAQHGFACVTVGYRLAPLHTFPAAVADIQAFMAYARENGKAHGWNSSQIIALGNSAGGHLSAMAGLAPTRLDTQESAQKADAFVAISAITDLRNPNDCHYPIAMSFLEQFMGASHFEEPERYKAASPLTYVTEDAPPSLLIHGEADDVVPVEQTRSLYGALTQAGATSELHLLPRQGHSFTLDAWNHIRKLTLEFIETL